MQEVVICNRSTAEHTTEQKIAQFTVVSAGPMNVVYFRIDLRLLAAAVPDTNERAADSLSHLVSLFVTFHQPYLDPTIDPAQCIKNSACKPFML
jgi:hypothetical protein